MAMCSSQHFNCEFDVKTLYSPPAEFSSDTQKNLLWNSVHLTENQLCHFQNSYIFALYSGRKVMPRVEQW